MGSSDVSEKQPLRVNVDGTATILLDPATVTVLVREAKTSRKTPAALAAAVLREALEDLADARDARRVLADIKAGREKVIDGAAVFRRNGL